MGRVRRAAHAVLIAGTQVVDAHLIVIFRTLGVIGKGLVHILLAAQSPLIAKARLALGPGMSVSGRLFVEGQGLGIVPRNVLPGIEHVAQAVGGKGVAQIYGPAIQLHGPLGILFHPRAVFITHAQSPHTVRIVLLRRFRV